MLPIFFGNITVGIQRQFIFIQQALRPGRIVLEDVISENLHEDQIRHIQAEFYRLVAAQADVIRQAQQQGGRVIAVGTTVTRMLETIMQEEGQLTAHSGWSRLFIYPGYQFRAVELLITNFHLARSTLFLLVCAFAGGELMRQAYRIAIAERYRFYSYGDAMLIH